MSVPLCFSIEIPALQLRSGANGDNMILTGFVGKRGETSYGFLRHCPMESWQWKDVDRFDAYVKPLS